MRKKQTVGRIKYWLIKVISNERHHRDIAPSPDCKIIISIELHYMCIIAHGFIIEA